MAQQSSIPAQPTLFNMPPEPQSTPDTPSEIPGTPTSTTTSLSAISTTAMKDGQRGHVPPLALEGSSVRGAGIAGSSYRLGHQHNPSTNSLEAERADRISRLTGLSGVSTLRPTYAPNRGSAASVTSGNGGGGGSVGNNNPNRFSGSGLFASTSVGGGGGGSHLGSLNNLGMLSNNMAVPGPLTPAFFDAHGQPVAITKMSTVGTASATDSISGRTLDDTSTADGDTMTEDGDGSDGQLSSASDIKSMGTNYHYSNSRRGDGDAMMADDDNTNQSVGGYDDRMSDDDGAASLVGFGEGAGSTVSGPIYRRRPLPPPTGSSAGAMAANIVYNNNNNNNSNNNVHNVNTNSSGHMAAWGLLERTNSGLSDTAVMGSTSGSAAGRRTEYMRSPLEYGSGGGGGSGSGGGGGGDDDMFVDNPTNGSIQAQPSALRETQRPRSHQQQQQTQYSGGVSREREAAEQLLQGVAGYQGQDTLASRYGTGGAGGAGGHAGSGPTERYPYEERR